MTSLDTIMTCDGGFGCDCLQQRKKLQKSKRRKVILHGTRGGYQRHIRERSPACAPCTAANREYHQDYLKGKANGAA